MKFSSFWIFPIEVFVSMHSPCAKKIPLNPPFSKGEMTQRGPIPLFEKEGPGEILDKYGLMPFSHCGGLNTANTLSEFVIHDSKNTDSSGLRLSSAIAPAKQNQLSSS